MGHEEPERREADQAGADVLVAVEPRAESGVGRPPAIDMCTSQVVARGARPGGSAPGAPGTQPSFFTSARIFAGSGSSPRP